MEASWFDLVPPGAPPATRLEVDAASLANRGWGPEVRLRVTHAQPQVHPAGFGFQSFQAVVRFDCPAEALVPIAVSYFDGPAGQGALTGTETNLSAGGIHPGVLSSVDEGTRRSLVRAGCPSA